MTGRSWMKTLALSMVALVAGFVPAAGFAATGPAFTLTTPATTAFPSTALNATSSAQTIVVTTTRAVTITSVAIPLTVNGWAEFKVGTVTGCTTDGSASTASGTACSIPVTFAPHYSGNRVQTLTITDSTGLVYTVGLTGFGNGPQSVLGPGYVYSNGVTGGGYGGDGGSPVSAKFSTVTGMVSDAVSNQYIGDYGNHNVRVIYNGGAALACLIEIEQPTLFGLTAGTTSCLGATSAPVVGDVYTIAGDVTVGTHTYVGSADAVLATATPTSNTNATLNTPSQIAVDANGNVIIADYAALKVRVVYAGGDAMACLIEVEEPTLFGLSSSATSCAGATSAPIPGYIYTLFGSGGSIPTTVPVSVTQAGDGAKATLATAGNIIGVAIDPAGDVFIADDSTSNLRTARIRVVYAGGANAAALITLENPGTTPVLGNVYRLAGGIFASTGDNTLANNGGGLLYSRGLTIDPDGNVIFTDYSTTTGTTEAKVRVIYYAGIRMASLITKENPTYPTPTPGFLYTLAGNSGNITTSTATNGDGGLASAATLTVPYGVALDPAGDIYVADYSGYNVRKISQSTGVITTVIGTGVHASATGNALTTATLWNPWGVSFGSSGTIYVTDYGVYHERYDSIVPATVNFATATPVGSVSTPQYVYLPNVGTSALTVASIVPSSGFTTTPAKSALYPDCIATLVLQPGDTCVVAVEFAPVAGSSGTISGTLTVSDNSSNIAANPHSVTLTGLAAVQTQVTLTAAPATTVDQGTNVTFTAVVAIVAGQTVPSGAAALGGTVQFNDGSTPIGAPQTIDPVTFTAQISTSTLTGGVHTISAVFTPATTDYSPAKQTLTETVVAPAFTVATTNAGVAVTIGGTVTVPFAITAVGGYTGKITATCSNLPANMICNIGPALVVTGDGTSSMLVTFVAAATTGANVSHGGTEVVVALLGLPVLLVLARRRRFGTMLAVLLVMVAGAGLSGCSTAQPKPATGTYGVTVNFTDGSNTVPVPETVSVTGAGWKQ